MVSQDTVAFVQVLDWIWYMLQNLRGHHEVTGPCGEGSGCVLAKDYIHEGLAREISTAVLKSIGWEQ